MISLKTPHDIDTALQEKDARFFKHSTQCPISATAYKEVNAYERMHQEHKIYLIDVINNKPASKHLEHRTGIRHESPQFIVVHDGQVVWHADHYAITQIALEKVNS